MGKIKHHVKIPNFCVYDLASSSTVSASPEINVIYLDSLSILSFLLPLKNTPKYYY